MKVEDWVIKYGIAFLIGMLAMGVLVYFMHDQASWNDCCEEYCSQNGMECKSARQFEIVCSVPNSSYSELRTYSANLTGEICEVKNDGRE